MRDKISWQTHEYEFRHKGPDWFWAFGIIVVALALVALITNNILFAVLILLGAFTITHYAKREPDILDYEINNKGVKVGKTLYTYTSLESFWISEHEDKKKLILKSKKMIMPILVFPITNEVSADEARELLKKFLHEEELYEPIAEKLMDYFGF